MCDIVYRIIYRLIQVLWKQQITYSMKNPEAESIKGLLPCVRREMYP